MATLSTAAAATHHVTAAITDLRGAAEGGLVAGFVQACQAIGLHTSAWRIKSRQPRPPSILTVVFADVDHLPTALLAEASTVFFPIVRRLEEVDRLRTVDTRGEIWVASPTLARRLREAGLRVTEVGVSMQSGQSNLRSRRSFGLREVDFVTACRVREFDHPAEAALRSALQRLCQDPRRQFESTSYVVDVTDAQGKAKRNWFEWAQQIESDQLVLLDEISEPAVPALVATCDGWVVLREDAWYPWWTLFAAYRAKATIALPHLADFGLDVAVPGLVQGLGSSDDQARSLVEAITTARLAPRPGLDAERYPLLRSRLGARACGCQIIEALRASGCWDRLVWGALS